MAGRGPARTPDPVLKLHGRKRDPARDGPGDAVKVPGDMPTCPTKLCAAAKTEWRRIAKVLGSVDGMVTGTDRATLIGYCHAYAQFWRLDEIVTDEGDILEDGSGRHYKNPAAVMMADARTAMLRFSQELGFTPASRSRVRVSEKPKGDTPKFEVDVG